MKYVVFFLIFLAACARFGFPSKDVASVALPKIHVGVKGLSADFQENLPPEKLFENQLFVASVKLKNEGAVDIDRGYFSFGVEDQLIEVFGNKVGSFSLKGRSLMVPVGEDRSISLRSRARGIPVQRIDTSLTFTACYPYRTEAVANVCIDTDIEKKISGKKPCQVSVISLSEGQGAPVVVDSVETSMVPGDGDISADFVIRLSNQGSGDVFSVQNVVDRCRGRTLSGRDAMVRVSVELPDRVVSCDRSELVLKESDNVIRCSASGFTSDLGTYVSQLKVNVDYGYAVFIRKNLEIQKTTADEDSITI